MATNWTNPQRVSERGVSAIYDACVLYPFEIRDVLMVAALMLSSLETLAISNRMRWNLMKLTRSTRIFLCVMYSILNLVYL